MKEKNGDNDGDNMTIKEKNHDNKKKNNNDGEKQ